MPFTVSTVSNVDTDSPLCASTVSGAENYCVIAATNITIAATLRATGKKPLVLIATDSIITTGQIILIGGAGSNPSACSSGTPRVGGGGRAGGSFVGVGGAGGAGSDGGAGGMPAGSVADVTGVRGGCSGEGAGDAIAAGAGGGAVSLIAGNRIDIQGGINASGEGGGPGDGPGGGVGGGAGGMIGLEAPIITCNSLLLASGGGGGGGGGGPFEGSRGSTPDSITAATGGSGVNGGAGGSGSTPSRGAPGMAGSPGLAGNPPGGGGGGGGGAGLIKAPATANLGTMVSPPPTP